MDTSDNLTEKFSRTTSILKYTELQRKGSITDDETTSRRKSKRVSFSANVQLKLFEKGFSNDKNDDSVMKNESSVFDNTSVGNTNSANKENISDQLDVVSMELGDNTDINIEDADITYKANMTCSFMDVSIKPMETTVDDKNTSITLENVADVNPNEQLIKPEKLIEIDRQELVNKIDKELDEKFKIKKMAETLLAKKKEMYESILKSKQRALQVNKALELKNDELQLKIKNVKNSNLLDVKDYLQVLRKSRKLPKIKKAWGNEAVEKFLSHFIYEKFTGINSNSYGNLFLKKITFVLKILEIHDLINKNNQIEENIKDLNTNFEILHKDFSNNFNKIKKSSTSFIEFDEYNKLCTKTLTNLTDIAKVTLKQTNADSVLLTYFFNYIEIELDFSNIGLKNLLKDVSKFENLTPHKIGYHSKIDDNSPEYLKFILCLIEREVNANYLKKKLKKINDSPIHYTFLRIFYEAAEDLANDLLFCVEKYKRFDFDFSKYEVKFYYSNDPSQQNYFRIKFDSILSIKQSISIEISLSIDDEIQLTSQTYENVNLRECLAKAEEYLRTMNYD